MKTEQITNALRCFQWLPAYGWQRLVRRSPGIEPVHLIIAVADHFEPSHIPESGTQKFASLDVQKGRLERWCGEYPKLVDSWRDDDGHPFRHTYFYPAEQYDKSLIEILAEHCHSGWGEIEIHLHHGIERPDTAANTERMLLGFRDVLVKHGCLSRWNGEGPPRYAFAHGNWALANASGGLYCGVDEEMQILSDTGCYADMSLPAAPDPAQVTKINDLYECALPLTQRAPQRWGNNLRRGHQPKVFPLIVQGPLGLNFARRIGGLPVPNLENGALTTAYPPSMHRLNLWRQAAIVVEDQQDWVFIKLHCHGMDPRDDEAMLGGLMKDFLTQLTARAHGTDHLHFVTAREMVNIILAACDGQDGNPGEYRDYRLKLITRPSN